MKSATLLLLVGLLVCALAQAQTNRPTPDQVRQAIAQSISDLKITPVAVGTVENKLVSSGTHSVTIRIYRPTQTSPNRPIIYQIHGGAWVAGDLDTHDNSCRRLCHDADAVVVAVDYRRPPEHPYPASFDDAMMVLLWIQTNRGSLSQTGPLILLGDSAGGNLVAATCLRNASAANPIPIAAQILINPALDVRLGSPVFTNYELMIRWGLPDLSKANDPDVSPLAATNLRVMPPTGIVVCEQDERRADGVHPATEITGCGGKKYLVRADRNWPFRRSLVRRRSSREARADVRVETNSSCKTLIL